MHYVYYKYKWKWSECDNFLSCLHHALSIWEEHIAAGDQPIRNQSCRSITEEPTRTGWWGPLRLRIEQLVWPWGISYHYPLQPHYPLPQCRIWWRVRSWVNWFDWCEGNALLLTTWCNPITLKWDFQGPDPVTYHRATIVCITATSCWTFCRV